MTVGLKKFSDYNLLTGVAMRGDETMLLADTSSNGTVTATTISATAATNTISDSANSLPVVKSGALVLVSGFTDAGGELNALHTVVSSDATELVVATDITADEAAGQSVTVSEVSAMYQITADEFSDFISKGSTPVVNESASSRTLSLIDSGKYIRCTNSSGCAITVPPQSDENWPANAEIHGRSTLNSTTFIEGSGVSIAVPSGLTLEAGDGAAWTLKREAEDEWVLIGSLVGAP